MQSDYNFGSIFKFRTLIVVKFPVFYFNDLNKNALIKLDFWQLYTPGLKTATSFFSYHYIKIIKLKKVKA